jgi:hypothetical protein
MILLIGSMPGTGRTWVAPPSPGATFARTHFCGISVQLRALGSLWQTQDYYEFLARRPPGSHNPSTRSDDPAAS